MTQAQRDIRRNRIPRSHLTWGRNSTPQQFSSPHSQTRVGTLCIHCNSRDLYQTCW